MRDKKVVDVLVPTEEALNVARSEIDDRAFDLEISDGAQWVARDSPAGIAVIDGSRRSTKAINEATNTRPSNTGSWGRTMHENDIYHRENQNVQGVQGGGARRSRIRPSKPTHAAHAAWVSTGRKATLRDGSKRTVYRNAKTGALATKRMVERNGKKAARYVKIA